MNSNMGGVAAMVCGTFAYTVCDAIGKWVVAEHSVAMLLLVRSIVAFAILVPLLHRRGWRQLIALEAPRLTFARTLAAAVETSMFFLAVRFLALADVMAIYLAAPVLVTALAPVLLDEKVGWWRWGAVIVGFCGILVVLRPGSGTFETVSLIALIGMVALAGMMLSTRRLRGTDPAVLVTWQIIATGLIGLAGFPLYDSTPGALDLGLMALVGLFAMAGQFLMVIAMRLAAASVVAPLFYTGIVWAALADLLVWQHTPEPLTVAGVALVILSGSIITWRERRRSDLR